MSTSLSTRHPWQTGAPKESDLCGAVKSFQTMLSTMMVVAVITVMAVAPILLLQSNGLEEDSRRKRLGEKRQGDATLIS